MPDRSDSYKDMLFFFDVVAGSIYAAQGSEAVGMEIIRRSLPLETLLKGSRGLPDMLNMVGAHYEMEGNRLLSERCFRDALKFAEEAGDEKDAASALGYLSDIYVERQDYTQALRYLNRQRQLTEKLSDQKEHVRTLARIGDLYRKQKLYAPAMEHYKRSQRIVETTLKDESLGGYLNDIAEIHHLLGDEAEALEVAELSRGVAQRAGERETLWQARSIAGRAYLALNRRQEAFQALDEAISSIEFIRLHLVGGEQDRQLFLENKITPYHAMVELLVRQNRAGDALYYAERSKARELLDVMQFGRLNLEAALTAEEQAKNVQLLNRLTTLNVELRQEQQRKPEDQSKLKHLSREIQRARLAYETFQADIYARHPQLQNLPAGAVPLLANEAASLLPGADGALLEFVVTPARTYLFVLTKETSAGQAGHAAAGGEAAPSQAGWNVYPIDINADELAKRVRRYLGAIAPADSNQRSNDFKAQAGGLYDLLLKPAQAQLRGKSALVVVPDGVLWNLPFQALQTPAGRFLLEDSAISYAPSLSVLREMRRLRDARGLSKARESVALLPGASTDADARQTSLLLAFGDPELGAVASGSSPFTRRNQLEPLPETATEVKSAVNLYGAQRGKYLIGADATEENFKRLAGDYKMLHLATHGLVNDKQPMYSQIVLSKTQRAGQTGAPPTEDGYLEAWEIMRLKLNADLVILSACETALGRVGNGEGMIGLTWSLSAAGTPTIIASQWAVNSCSTTELMVEFHRQFKDRVAESAPGVGPAEAMRRAALQFLHPNVVQRQNPSGTEGARCSLSAGNKQHPYFWAGFIVIGDGR